LVKVRSTQTSLLVQVWSKEKVVQKKHKVLKRPFGGKKKNIGERVANLIVLGE
jgi:hypothetical protein